MLFVLLMEVLNSLVFRASQQGLLKLLLFHGLWHQHQPSLYADDAVLWIQPVVKDMETDQASIAHFGEASGLKAIHKSQDFCHTNQVQRAGNLHDHLTCEIRNFPGTYIGLPLSMKLTKTELQPFVDKVADYLPSWRAPLMNRSW